MIWHNSSIDEVIGELNTDKEKGLYSEAASARLAQYGKNELRDYSKKSFFSYLFKEVKSLFVIFLAIIAVVYAVITTVTSESGVEESIAVLVSLAICLIMNAFAKYKANKTLYHIGRDTGSYVSVIRNGEDTVIPSRELVPGDIMLIKAGDYIKADGRLIDSYALTCDEFKLSGISVPTEKSHEGQFDDITPISARSNMLYLGSTVVNGRGLAVVTETAFNTEFGKLKKIKNQTEDDATPLSDKLQKIARIFSTSGIIASIVVFIFAIIFNFSATNISFAKTVVGSLLLSFSICFIAIPELITSLLNVALSYSAQRLKREKVNVKNLQIIENLRDVTVICTDKTGVITTGDMTVEKMRTDRGDIILGEDEIDETAATILRLALICSNFKQDEHTERHTNNMERAIEEAAIKYLGTGKADIDGIYPTVAEIPFDSQRMLMTTVSVINGTPYAIVKGAPEVIAQRCVNLGAEQINEMSDELADGGLKVIAVAMNPLSEIPANPNCDELEHDLTFVGLIGFKDKIERSTAALCEECLSADVKMVMITGDHLNTARQAALKLGIIEDENMAISGDELSAMTDEELAENIDKYRVFARVSPEDKLRIVTALKARLENVAVTGDTIADTPAVLEADVGCALGLTSADVIKDSSDLVLEKNRIASLVAALKESGTLLFSLKNSVYYLATDLAVKLLVVLFGMFIFGSSPLTVSSLMMLTVITCLLPKYAFFTEKRVIDEPLGRDALKFFDRIPLIKTISATALTTVSALVGYGVVLSQSKAFAQITAFTVIALSELLFAFSLSRKKCIFTGLHFHRKSMPIAVGGSVALLIIGLCFLSGLNTQGIIFSICAAIGVFLLNEVFKLLLPKIIR